MYSLFLVLYRDYSKSLTLSNVCEQLKPCSEPPRRRNVLKKYFRKKGAMHRQILNSGLACVLSVLFTPLGEVISAMKYLLSRQLYFAYLAVFFT